MINDKKPSIATTIFGAFAGLFIALSAFFKMMHWPGAAPILIIGGISFTLFYLPLWLIQQGKKGRWLILIYQFILLEFLCITFVLKTLHWPGSGPLFFIWMNILVFVVFPISIVQLFKASVKSLTQFHIIIVLFILAGIVYAGVNSASSGMNRIANSFSKNTIQLSHSLEKLQKKNKQLYSTFDSIREKEQNVYYHKSLKVKQLTDSTENYLRRFRNHLIALQEGVSESEADSMELEDIRDKSQSEITTVEVCGRDDYKPRTGEFSGIELKKVLNIFKDSVLSFASEENQNFIKAGMNLDTEPSVNEKGEQEDWVFATFKYVPISAVLLTLETMHYEIKNAEAQVVADIVNSSRKSFDNLAVKIVDLGSQLEEEKNRREIEKLKSERELAKITMDTKNRELDNHQKTITWFVIGFLSFIVMLFYIIRSNIMRKKTNRELQSQKQIIETKNKEITDSINYAKRIQQAILPPDDIIYNSFNQSFVLYQPKDVVSGDFYGFFKKDDFILIAVADCTGHGVPGAFMSMIGHEQLSKIILEKGISKPSDILNELHVGIRKALKQDATGESRDGMDIALCKIYLTQKKLEYAGANRPLWIIRNNELIETKADKQPIGGLETDSRKLFTNHIVNLEEKDCIYLFTDGYADQFGGDKGKKFMVKNFERNLVEIQNENMKQQKQQIHEKFNTWKGKNEQVDDVLVIGIKI